MGTALLWNVSLTALLAVLLTGLSQLAWLRRRPAVIHWLWLLLLAKLITPPLFFPPLLPAEGERGEMIAAAAAPPAPETNRNSNLVRIPSVDEQEKTLPRASSPQPAVPPPDVEIPLAGVAVAPTHHPTTQLGNRSADAAVSSEREGVPRGVHLLALWLFGTCAFLAVCALHAMKLDRWLRRARCEHNDLAACCAEVATEMGLCGRVLSGVVEARTTPLLWAWGQPVVIVPRQLVAELDARALRNLVAHELAHLIRRDHWANAFAGVVKALFWWNPVVWWADRQLRAAQELCCDAMAMERCRTDRRSYATALLKALDFVQGRPPAQSRLASTVGSRGALLRRFEMMGERTLSYRVSRWTILGMVMLAAALICMPVRAQEETPAARTAPATEKKDNKGASAEEKSEELDANKEQLRVDFRDLTRLIGEFREKAGRLPDSLKELEKPLPKDVYSPTGDSYHYEPGPNRSILSSCGQDGVYGNGDDEIYINYWGGATSGRRSEIFPLKGVPAFKPQKDSSFGPRPHGDCSISGKVVSAATGKPISGATVYLFCTATHKSIFVNVASDGTFTIKDIPTGPYTFQVTNTAGYQNEHYDPEGKGGPMPRFSLKEGEQRTGVVFKLKPACRISGKVLDENGKVPQDTNNLVVLAVFPAEGREGYDTTQGRVSRSDGSYLLDRLANKPTYVLVINWREARTGTVYPPIYYPSTFSRDEAKQITFDSTSHVENVDITMKKEGGLVLEGTIVDEKGAPVPEAFLVMHHRDMLFDFVTAYTDKQGKYRLHGLGKGELLVHIDAAHRGLARTRVPVDLDGSTEITHRDFTLVPGVSISGKLVTKGGKPWDVGRGYGYAAILDGNQTSRGGSFSLTGFRNQFAPQNAKSHSAGSFLTGEGGYQSCDMVFPSESTFVIQGLMPGKTQIGFSPKAENKDVVEILVDGCNIKGSTIKTTPGDEIKNVVIVIGEKTDGE